MLFNSYPFVFLFLPITLAGFFTLGRRSRGLAIAWLALASLFFYGWWNPVYVGLLLASITFNYLVARCLHFLDTTALARHRKPLLVLAVGANLGLLAYYKYTGFFLRNLNALAGTHLAADIILPLGISFFTFTQIAFLVDTYRREVHEFNVLHYGLFVTYFPHLIAGPILHHKEIMPQFRQLETYRPDYRNLAIGLSIFAIGLFKKVNLADGFAPDVTPAFKAASAGAALGLVDAWRGALAYTLQLYFDFSGYCDMAIGVSLLFGITLPLNFNSPYQATGIVDFWRRWHMTLSRFLRDYLYIPLGGNRQGTMRRYLNLFLTMLLGGLWHGANWTFVAWGALHGLYLMAEHAVGARRSQAPSPGLRPIWARSLSSAATFFLVVVGWVFFRAEDLTSGVRFLAAMAGLNGLGSPLPPQSASDVTLLLQTLGLHATPLAVLGIAQYLACLYVVFCLPNTQAIVDRQRYFKELGPRPTSTPRLSWAPSPTWSILLALMTAASLVRFSRVSEFLYFQF